MNIKATILFGALLSSGSLFARSPDVNQSATSSAEAATPISNSQREHDPAKQAAHLGKQLGLSGDQVAQITPILADRQQQLQNLRADNSLRPRVRRAKAKEILKDSTAKVKAILNDTQKQQFEQKIADRKAHRHQ
jgi:Spy/CpxP family protein refolding chaperone